MSSIDKQYTNLLQDILDNGFEKNTRNGKVLSVFGRTIRHNMKDGFPLLTTKKMHFKGIVTELLWFLQGRTDLKYLLNNDCHIWDGDCYKNYLRKVIRDKNIIRYLKSYSIDTKGIPTIEPYSKDEFIERIKNDDEFANKWGNLGKIYGHFWRNWNGNDEFGNKGIDQIANVINNLKTDPDSRRLLVTAWNPSDLSDSVLPPCHYGFQMYTRELTGEERWELLKNKVGEERFKSMVDEIVPFGGGLSQELESYNISKRAISLIWTQRSCDFPLGIPYNIASYALLLEIIAKQVNMIPEEVIGNLGDCHIYTNQIEGVKEQLTRVPYELPTVRLSDRTINDISEYTLEDFTLENYQSHSAIKMPLSN